MRPICRTALAFVGASLGLLGLALPALAVEPLKGKTVTILVGTSPGGGYDSYARMLARYLPKHLPGTSVVVKNMTGGGGLRLATYLYGAAPADGTEFGVTEYGVPFSSLLYGTPVQFDVLRFNWLGAIDAYVTPMVLAWHASPFHRFEDVLARPMSVGATGATSFTAGYPYALNGILGAKFNVTLGYPGATDVTLAMERGELDGIVSWCWKCMKHQRPDWVTEDKARVLLQVATKGDPELDAKCVRTVMDVARSEDDKHMLRPWRTWELRPWTGLDEIKHFPASDTSVLTVWDGGSRPSPLGNVAQDRRPTVSGKGSAPAAMVSMP